MVEFTHTLKKLPHKVFFVVFKICYYCCKIVKPFCCVNVSHEMTI